MRSQVSNCAVAAITVLVVASIATESLIRTLNHRENIAIRYQSKNINDVARRLADVCTLE